MALALAATPALADPLTCNLSGYKAQSGLTAAVSDNTLALTWEGEKSEEVRMRLSVESGTPTIKEIAVRGKGGQWTTLASNVTPEYRVVSGLRRATDQQLKPLQDLKVPITPAVLDQIRWEAFWDAPLNVPAIRWRTAVPRRRSMASPISPACRASPKRSRARRPTITSAAVR
jgi:hypothetical protein